MILDNIKFLSNYSYVKNVDKAVKFLSENDCLALEDGQYDLGDQCCCLVSKYLTSDNTNKPQLEAHREYIDIQLVLSGREVIYIQALELADTIKEYDSNEDYELFTSNYVNTVVLDGSNFVILFPNDLHAGGFDAGDKQEVKKLVFKLKI